MKYQVDEILSWWNIKSMKYCINQILSQLNKFQCTIIDFTGNEQVKNAHNYNNV